MGRSCSCKSACGLVSGACRRLGQGHRNRGEPWKCQLPGVKVRYEGGTWQPPARLGLKSGLSSLSDSLGPLKDDMLLVETRGPQDNRSICALEPSGCTPLLSRASTVRAGGPFSMYLSSSISKLASNFPSSEPGSVLVSGDMGVIQTWALFSVVSQKSPNS